MNKAPKTSLERLLRLRVLEEDLAMQSLEACYKTVLRLEQREKSLVQWRVEIAREGQQALTTGETPIWYAGETEKQWSRVQGEKLRDELEASRERMVEQRALLLVRSSARMAVETLVDEANRKARYERERREQQSLDEWFQLAGGRTGHDHLLKRSELQNSNCTKQQETHAEEGEK